MRCEKCGTDTPKGTMYTVWYGNPVGQSSRSEHAVRIPGGTVLHVTYTTPVRIGGSDQVYVCYACQIARRRLPAWLALVGVLLIFFVPTGALVYVNVTEQLSLGYWVIPVILGGIGIGALWSSIGGIRDANRPYAVDGNDPDVWKTSDGELFAIGIHQRRRKGYKWYTRQQYASMRPSTSPPD